LPDHLLDIVVLHQLGLFLPANDVLVVSLLLLEFDGLLLLLHEHHLIGDCYVLPRLVAHVAVLLVQLLFLHFLLPPNFVLFDFILPISLSDFHNLFSFLFRLLNLLPGLLFF